MYGFLANGLRCLAVLVFASAVVGPALAQSDDYVKYARDDAPSTVHAVDALRMALATLDEKARQALALQLQKDKKKKRGTPAFRDALDDPSLAALLEVPATKPRRRSGRGGKKPGGKTPGGKKPKKCEGPWCL